MDFEELHEMIPYAKHGKEKILRMNPYPGITLAMPGRHALDTVPVGGDFVVMVTDETLGWTEHQFKHTDIFDDIEFKKTLVGAEGTNAIMKAYLDIVTGGDPIKWDSKLDAALDGGMNPYTFIRGVQCLAVAEHRRYAKFENKIGGRYLPFRFAAGIVEGEWSAQDCKDMQKLGRPGVESLESKFGVPSITKELFDCLKQK